MCSLALHATVSLKLCLQLCQKSAGQSSAISQFTQGCGLQANWLVSAKGYLVLSNLGGLQRRAWICHRHQAGVITLLYSPPEYFQGTYFCHCIGRCCACDLTCRCLHKLSASTRVACSQILQQHAMICTCYFLRPNASPRIQRPANHAEDSHCTSISHPSNERFLQSFSQVSCSSILQSC